VKPHKNSSTGRQNLPTNHHGSTGLRVASRKLLPIHGNYYGIRAALSETINRESALRHKDSRTAFTSDYLPLIAVIKSTFVKHYTLDYYTAMAHRAYQNPLWLSR
jgi:hypothetical protein